jgi:hypothetical protein
LLSHSPADLIGEELDELIRQAAQGEVLHNDDTCMRVLHLEREPADQRTGVFTSGIVATDAGARLRCTSPAANTPARIWLKCLRSAHRSWVRRFRCVTRPRATCPNYPRAWKSWWLTASRMAGARFREDRIHNEAIVDACGAEERTMGWYYYLEDQRQFPLRPDALSLRQ